MLHAKVEYSVRSTVRRPLMASGTIKKVVADRGFGFITGEDGKDYFFHRDGLNESIDFDRLVGGENVTFDVESNPRGPRAANIKAAE
jgi:CspA family cold shock protein